MSYLLKIIFKWQISMLMTSVDRVVGTISMMINRYEYLVTKNDIQ